MKHESKEVDYKLLKVSSSAFKNNEFIPLKYTCDGVNVSPPLDIDNIPEEAKSLCIVVDDPDAPAKIWVHWIMWNIPVTHHLRENEAHGLQGMNDFNKKYYGGPCPPGGTHRYFFKVYALDCTIDLPVTSTKHNLEKAISGHILAFGELIGLYKRK
jgi:Raf kinase inhibitor-like protein, YbhB/YbcL family